MIYVKQKNNFELSTKKNVTVKPHGIGKTVTDSCWMVTINVIYCCQQSCGSWSVKGNSENIYDRSLFKTLDWGRAQFNPFPHNDTF